MMRRSAEQRKSRDLSRPPVAASIQGGEGASERHLEWGVAAAADCCFELLGLHHPVEPEYRLVPDHLFRPATSSARADLLEQDRGRPERFRRQLWMSRLDEHAGERFKHAAGS